MSRPPGLPLLSGPPPPPTAPDPHACRKCAREFSILFNRQRKCMHCGYAYCSSCTDYQALMPRRGPAHGYDLAPVCGFCIEMLNVTALGRAQLRLLPLAKLRRYIDAYNIPVKNPVDKNDLVDAVVAARAPQGCLSPVNENYYRKYSVPSSSTPGSSHSHTANRNTFSRGSPTTNATGGTRTHRPFPRPDLDPNRRQQPQEPQNTTYTPRPTSNATRHRTTSAPSNPGTARPTGRQPNATRPTSSSARQSAPRTTSTTNASSSRTASTLTPPMSTLVTLPRSSLSALSVGTLKQILWAARVRVPPGVVEKEELVERVWATIEEERRKNGPVTDDVDLDVDEEETEDIEEPAMEIAESEANQDSEMAHEEHPVPAMDYGLPPSRPTTPQPASSHPPASPTRSKSPSPRSGPRPRPPKSAATERSGLCVICQDEEANIAIVDCGHLAMCRACSDLVLASSRECPLCRTRIVTEARLLRIFKT